MAYPRSVVEEGEREEGGELRRVMEEGGGGWWWRRKGERERPDKLLFVKQI